MSLACVSILLRTGRVIFGKGPYHEALEGNQQPWQKPVMAFLVFSVSFVFSFWWGGFLVPFWPAIKEN